MLRISADMESLLESHDSKTLEGYNSCVRKIETAELAYQQTVGLHSVSSFSIPILRATLNYICRLSLTLDLRVPSATSITIGFTSQIKSAFQFWLFWCLQSSVGTLRSPKLFFSNSSSTCGLR